MPIFIGLQGRHEAVAPIPGEATGFAGGMFLGTFWRIAYTTIVLGRFVGRLLVEAVPDQRGDDQAKRLCDALSGAVPGMLAIHPARISKGLPLSSAWTKVHEDFAFLICFHNWSFTRDYAFDAQRPFFSGSRLRGTFYSPHHVYLLHSKHSGLG